MTLFICIDCRKIIGCSQDTHKIECLCDYCNDFDECLAETPIGKPVGRRVFFVHYSNSCDGHQKKKIGFRRRQNGNSP